MPLSRHARPALERQRRQVGVRLRLRGEPAASDEVVSDSRQLLPEFLGRLARPAPHESTVDEASQLGAERVLTALDDGELSPVCEPEGDDGNDTIHAKQSTPRSVYTTSCASIVGRLA